MLTFVEPGRPGSAAGSAGVPRSGTPSLTRNPARPPLVGFPRGGLMSVRTGEERIDMTAEAVA
ncbi:hypothetical protein ACIRPX_37550 [Streptomyces sp. NPDC101225]|uniref:hypothetical protein n=1 Tax=Streptomyces sp. NPDC101225 TaxID=3366135 RepID=UPI0038276F68